jgi:hypothetical protein
MNAEQYRALVQKLEAIQEAETTEPPNMAAAMDTALPPAADPNAVANAPDSELAQKMLPPSADPNQIPTIEAATFSQAYAQAAKQGLKKFKWCGIYAVKAKPRPVMPQPKPPIKPNPPNGYYVPKQDYTVTNPMGDFDPTAFNGQAAARR